MKAAKLSRRVGRMRRRMRGGAEAGGAGTDLGANVKEIDGEINILQNKIALEKAELHDFRGLQEKALQDTNKQNLQVDQDRFKESVFSKRLWEFMRGLIAKTWSFLAGFLGKLWVPASHYVVFFLVIFLMLYGFSALFDYIPQFGPNNSQGGQQDKSKSSVAQDDANFFRRMWNRFVRWIRSLFYPGYAVKSTLSIFDTRKAMTTAVPRDRMVSGRCDNMQNIDSTTEGVEGKCTTAYEPAPYQFNIPVEAMPEWSKLPDSFKQANQEKLTLYMPYVTRTQGPEDTFYVPQCEGTYYIDEKGNKHLANLYKENGLSCSLAEKPSTLYNKFKPRDGSGYGYAK
jgi:hypothetical protein